MLQPLQPVSLAPASLAPASPLRDAQMGRGQRVVVRLCCSWNERIAAPVVLLDLSLGVQFSGSNKLVNKKFKKLVNSARTTLPTRRRFGA
jgi:hypothetical protein